MFSCGDYEKVKQDVWEENWKAMRLYSVVALVAFGVITLVSVFSLSIGKFKWVYLVYTFLSLVYFCISRCQLRSFLGKELVVYSFFAALLLFGIITGTLITPEELTVNYIVFMMAAPLLFTARTAVMNGLILSSMLLYIGLAFFAQHNPILSKNLVDVILYGSQQARIAGTNPELREIPHGHGSVCRFRRKSGQSTESTGGVYRTACGRRSSVHL